jgi:mannose-1-phosphate guanylyltransferase
MKALLLSAGLGTRLRPITNLIPKCLVPINGKPLLEYWLVNLSKVGITEFLINTHYFSEQVIDFIYQSKYKSKVTIVQEDKLLNTAGTILANKTFFQSNKEPFMVIHADNLCFCDFNAFINSHLNRNKKTELTMMLFKTNTPSSCGIVECDNQNIVQKFHEKVKNPPSNLANGAVYICEQTLFDFLASCNKKEIDFSLDVLPNYLGKINTFLNTVYHRDIGTLESYSLAQVEIKSLDI